MASYTLFDEDPDAPFMTQAARSSALARRPPISMPSSGVEVPKPGEPDLRTAGAVYTEIARRMGMPPETGPLIAQAKQREEQSRQDLLAGLALSLKGGSSLQPLGGHVFQQALKTQGPQEIPGGWGTVTSQGVTWNPEKQREADLSRLTTIGAALEKAETSKENAALRAMMMGSNQANTQGNRTFQQENALRDDFEKQVKDQRISMATYPQIEAALSGPPTAAGDMRAIFRYMKMLDPTSVVREGEYATARNAAGVPAQVLNLYNKALTGVSLTPAQRKDFLAQAQSERDTALKFFNSRANEFHARARTYGLNPRNVVLGYDTAAPAPQQQEEEIPPDAVRPRGSVRGR